MLSTFLISRLHIKSHRWCECNQHVVLYVIASAYVIKPKNTPLVITYRYRRLHAKPFGLNKKETVIKTVSFWCARRDLNPYVINTRPSNVPVCQFQHLRELFNSRQRCLLYLNVSHLSTLNLNFFKLFL